MINQCSWSCFLDPGLFLCFLSFYGNACFDTLTVKNLSAASKNNFPVERFFLWDRKDISNSVIEFRIVFYGLSGSISRPRNQAKNLLTSLLHFSIFLAKDMTKFYRTYAKLIANKDPKRKDVGIGPQFWKQIEDKTAEKEIKMKNDEKKE